MVLHRLPYDSTFLCNKFYQLQLKMDVWLVAWDQSANVKKMPFLTEEIRSRIITGPSDTGIASAVKHFIHAASLFFRVPAYAIRFFFFLQKAFGTAKALGKFIKFYPFLSVRPALVHFEFGTLGRDMIFLKDFFKFKVVVSFRGYDLNYVGLETASFYDSVWAHADGIHFLGKDLQQRAYKRGYKGTGKQALISPAIDINYFTRKREYPLENSPFVIISVGRIVWKKGLEYGARAIKQLVDMGFDVEYRVIGTGEFVQAVQFVVFELGIEKNVRFLGHKPADQIVLQLEEAHVFFHPSVSEGFCNAVIEAQAMELPVVCSDADGLPENIENGITGFSVPKWDVDEMTEKLKLLYSDRKKSMEMGKMGRMRAEKLYSLSDQILRFKLFYLDILQS